MSHTQTLPIVCNSTPVVDNRYTIWLTAWCKSDAGLPIIVSVDRPQGKNSKV